MSDNRSEQMCLIKEAIVNLTESPLYEYRTENGYYPVIGQGSHSASIVFIARLVVNRWHKRKPIVQLDRAE